MQRDWWKWGDPNEIKHINDYPKLKTLVEDRWKTSLREEFFPPKKFELPQLSDKRKEQIKDIFAVLDPKKISFKDDDRLFVSLGKSYYDVIRIFNGGGFISPDVVITPTSHDEIQYILKQASDNNIAIIPFGGGTNVVGALSLDNLSGKSDIKCTLDLRKYKKLIQIDEEHLTATFEAGIFGPELEKILQAKGYTLGHFPQSFEYSTLGGWIVTRGAGQESTYYGKIEDLVEHIKVATPIGTLESNTFSHDASGINVLPLFVGSEGTLGVVTEISVKIKKLPKNYRWIVALFPDFQSGSQYLQELTQAGVKPSVVRLSDANETNLFSKMSSSEEQPGFVNDLKKEAQKLILQWKNLTAPCVLIMRFPQSNISVSSQVIYAKDLVAKHKGMLAPATIGDKWAENRFKLPYLRDTLVEHAIYIDTMETLVRWKDVQKMHQALTKELNKCAAFHKNKGIFLAHISHVYPNAACMYFTLITPMLKGREIEQWQDLKDVVTNTILQNNGSISHHHSVGLDHQKWYKKYLDNLAMDLLQSIKNKLDPKGIMNPGKLFS
ncbi:MAG TPA: FAD-binding oxidoreductase [Chitinophagales bacterium]|nr:FAD-binding oxidoreductase [Chitinophagales bacterium]HMX59326.1 FAD-binding oxidoreductase [Chitinophagales bacterium]HMZ32490.1 FAD-binding oxidoreductase [Chitinophagales bacterium]HNA39629.1 FAD-binding oxidoreductase [Chitinophagales bacterium]HNC72909.1 FAD-binding oxidoreductase [Chitinophagales bacterium]